MRGSAPAPACWSSAVVRTWWSPTRASTCRSSRIGDPRHPDRAPDGGTAPRRSPSAPARTGTTWSRELTAHGLRRTRHAVRDPRLDRRHPGAERRRLRHRDRRGAGRRSPIYDRKTGDPAERAGRRTASSATALRRCAAPIAAVVTDITMRLHRASDRRPLRRTGQGAGRRARRHRAAGGRSGEAVLGAAPRQGHGARPGRPGHLQRRVPSSPTRSWTPTRRRAGRPRPSGPGSAPDAGYPRYPVTRPTGRSGQAVGGLADRTGRFRQGLSRARAAGWPCPANTPWR